MLEVQDLLVKVTGTPGLLLNIVPYGHIWIMDILSSPKAQTTSKMRTKEPENISYIISHQIVQDGNLQAKLKNVLKS